MYERKKQIYENNIRQQLRAEAKLKYRNIFYGGQQANQELKILIEECQKIKNHDRLIQVSKICVDHYEDLDQDLVGIFLQILQDKQMKMQMNCNNINFMGKNSKKRNMSYQNFFQSTVQNYKCKQFFINQQYDEESSKNQMSININQINCVLEYWAQHLDKSKEIKFNFFDIMQNCMLQWWHLYKIELNLQILGIFLFRLQLLNKNMGQQIVNIIINVLQYNPNLGILQLLVQIIKKQQDHSPNYIIDLFMNQYLSTYLIKCLLHHDTTILQHSLRLLNQLTFFQNFTLIWPQNQLQILFKSLENIFLGKHNLQLCVIIIWYNITTQNSSIIKHYYEKKLNYQKIICKLKNSNRLDFYEFMIKILTNYCSINIVQKLIGEQMNLIDEVMVYSRDEKYPSLFELLLKAIMLHVQFFIEQFPKIISHLLEAAMQVKLLDTGFELIHTLKIHINQRLML